jgi:hypothetical protein
LSVSTLDYLRDVRRRVRTRAHAGVWFPVGVIAVLLLGSIALYVAPFAAPYGPDVSFLQAVTAPSWAGLPAPQRDAGLSYGYWFVGTPAAFAVIAWWYRRRARRVGLTVAWRRVVIVGLGALAGLAVLAAVPSATVDPYATSSIEPGWLHGLRTPLIPVALALIALGLTERSVTLVVTGGWIGVIAWWYSATFMGRLPGWLTYVLGGFEGPGLGGQVTLFDRPGPVLLVMALPLAVYAVVRGLRSHD